MKLVLLKVINFIGGLMFIFLFFVTLDFLKAGKAVNIGDILMTIFFLLFFLGFTTFFIIRTFNLLPVIESFINYISRNEITLTPSKLLYKVYLLLSLVFLYVGVSLILSPIGNHNWGIFAIIFGLVLSLIFFIFGYILPLPTAIFNPAGLRLQFSNRQKHNIPWHNILKIGIQDISGILLDPYIVIFLKDSTKYQFNPGARDKNRFQTAETFKNYTGGPIGDLYISASLLTTLYQAMSILTIDSKPGEWKKKFSDKLQEFGVKVETLAPLKWSK